MATIPLPELSLQPPQAPDLLGQMGKAVALKSMLQQQQYQQQMQPLQLQQEQLQVQQLQLAQQSRQAMLRAYTEPGAAQSQGAQGTSQGTTPAQPQAFDADAWGRRAMQLGADPSIVLPQVKDFKAQQVETEKLRGQQLDNAQKVNDAVGRQAQMLLGVPDQGQRAQTYQQISIPAMVQAGVPQNMIPQQVPDDLTLKAHAMAASNSEAWLKEARERQTYEQEHGVIDPARLKVINDQLTSIANTYKVPVQTLPEGSTWDHEKQLVSVIEQTGKAHATQAQIDTANGFKSYAQSLASLAAQEKITQLNKPTAAEENRADLAENLEENLNRLKDIAQRRPDLFGGFLGLRGGYQQWRAAHGGDDPDALALTNTLDQIGTAKLAAHQMRAAQHIETAANAITGAGGAGADAKAILGYDTPDGKHIPGAIDSAMGSLQTFKQQAAAARAGTRTGLTPDMVPTPPGGKPIARPQAQPAANLKGPVQPGEHSTSGPKGTVVWRGGKWVEPTTGLPPPQ